jgi:hypothetical protein
MLKLSISAAAVLLLAAPSFAGDAKCAAASQGNSVSQPYPTAMSGEEHHDAAGIKSKGGKDACALDINDSRKRSDT